MVESFENMWDSVVATQSPVMNFISVSVICQLGFNWNLYSLQPIVITEPWILITCHLLFLVSETLLVCL